MAKKPKKRCQDGRQNNRPPEHTRFKKGQSGNVTGKRKKRFTELSVIAEAEEQKVITVVTRDGGKLNMTKREARWRQLIRAAVKGDNTATRLVFELAFKLEKAGLMQEPFMIWIPLELHGA